jgi:transposase-like protein
LIAGEDYPQTWVQFVDWFPDEESCERFLERLRWPDGYICPRCGMAAEPYRASRARLVCRACRTQCSVTAGTVFEKTRTPLRTWFAAAWHVTNQKHGVSALGLQRELGLGSYQTAWSLMHRLRRAMVRPERERLSGLVEVDETFLRGRGSRSNKPRRAASKKLKVRPSGRKKSIVIMAVEVCEPNKFGRVRLRRVQATSKDQVLPFVLDAVEPGSTIRTDGSESYRLLPEYGYSRDRNVLLGSDEPAHVSLPAVHRVAALLKRWLLGIHHGSVQPHQLDYYLDEFTFRFNRRTSRSRGLLFYRLLEQAVITGPVTYRAIAAGKSEHRM